MDSDKTHKIYLQVILNNEIIFQSYGHWLFPLFDLEVFFGEHSINIAKGEVRDKVIGKAAAFLLLRLGAGCVHGDLMSELAVNVLSQVGISYAYGNLVIESAIIATCGGSKAMRKGISLIIICSGFNSLVLHIFLYFDSNNCTIHKSMGKCKICFYGYR